MKHMTRFLISAIILLFVATASLYSLPFKKIILKPEYQIATTLDGPLFFSNEKGLEDSYREYTFISESEVEYQVMEFESIAELDNPRIKTIREEYKTDFDEKNFQMFFNEFDSYYFTISIGHWQEYIILMEKARGISFTTSYEYPDSRGEYAPHEIIIIQSGAVEVAE